MGPERRVGSAVKAEILVYDLSFSERSQRLCDLVPVRSLSLMNAQRLVEDYP